MSCSACAKRRTGRIVPVTPGNKQGNTKDNANSAKEQGNTLRQVLRYTGR